MGRLSDREEVDDARHPLLRGTATAGRRRLESDPLLIAVLGIGGYMLLRRARGAPAGLAWLGWAVLLTALISPLCNLSVALFSAQSGST